MSEMSKLLLQLMLINFKAINVGADNIPFLMMLVQSMSNNPVKGSERKREKGEKRGRNTSYASMAVLPILYILKIFLSYTNPEKT